MVDVSAFALQPRWLWLLICVGASINDFGDVIAKFFADIAQPFGATAIFHGIMKQRADRVGFIGAVLKCDGSHPEDGRSDRTARLRACLISMRARLIKYS